MAMKLPTCESVFLLLRSKFQLCFSYFPGPLLVFPVCINSRDAPVLYVHKIAQVQLNNEFLGVECDT